MFSCTNCQSEFEFEGTEGFCPECEQGHCPECHTAVADDAPACLQCGAQFELFCPQCEAVITADDTQCASCGLVFTETTTLISTRAVNARSTLTQAALDGTLEDTEPETAECPSCQEIVYVEEGYCEECEATFCPSCIKVIEEDDATCPHCQTLLYFDCPACSFELAAGTDTCPNCNVLFPSHCPSCATEVAPTDDDCPACGEEIPLEERISARVVHTLVVSNQLVRVFACGTCGTHFDSRSGACGKCGEKVCNNCQLVLWDAEQACPKCGTGTEDEREDSVDAED